MPHIARILLAVAVVFSHLIFGSQTVLSEPASDVVYVEVKSAALRTQPQQWARSAAAVTYGDKLIVIKQEGNWLSVRTADGKEGYIHQSAITKKKVVLQAGLDVSTTDASETEVVLAGKGFSKAMEDEHRKQSSTDAYKQIDELEKDKVAPQRFEKFAEEGNLNHD